MRPSNQQRFEVNLGSTIPRDVGITLYKANLTWVRCMSQSLRCCVWTIHLGDRNEKNTYPIQMRSKGLDIWIVGSVEKGGWIGLCLGLLQLLSTNFPYPWRGWCGLPEYCTPNWDPTQLGHGVDRNFRPQLRTVPSQGPRSNTQLNQPTKIHL